MKKSILLATLVLLLIPAAPLNAGSQPVHLTCEYLVRPLGIDVRSPRFRWQIEDNKKNALQTAYRIRIATDSLEAVAGKGTFWDTGIVKSDRMLVPYDGTGELESFTRYFWTVQIWDRRGKKSRLSSVASFETGLFNPGDWKGTWITDENNMHEKPAPYFRKEFIPRGKIREARVYLAAAGLFELSVNGKTIGDHRLDPLFTRYDNRTLYVTHDVTPMVRQDRVVLGVILGNGWFNHQSTAVWYFHQAPWRDRPRFCLNLRITYEDGLVETIATGPDWKTSTGPIIFNSIYTGEHYDARLEQTGWDQPGFDDSGWVAARKSYPPSGLIVNQSVQPIRIGTVLPAQSMTRINDTTWIFDLGRNIAGVSSITLTGPAGTAIRMKHAEMLTEDGRADQSNIDVHYRPLDDSDPFQTDLFILKGQGQETFRPRFNYKGFRYVEVTSSLPVVLTRESLTGYFMHSDVPAAGSIRSSNPLLDKIWAATNASYLSNLYGYPTDCPQREKNGWTGDAAVAIETGLFNFDGITVYEKWLADHRDEQQPNGVLPAIIPTSGWGYTWANGTDWTSTIAIIPWNIYLFYGDSRLLEQCYDNIKRYVDYVTSISPSGLTDWGLGDWIPVTSVTPKEFTCSIYYYTDARILAAAAQLFGKHEDYSKYQTLADSIRSAINAKYLNRETGIYGSGFQTELSAALYWGIVPDELKTRVAENLKNRVLADSCHIDVGLLGSKTILNALSENGYANLAYTVALQDTYPSWGYWIVNGMTTLQENWPMKTSYDISRNHIMFGEIGAWFFKALGGIHPDPQQPGFRNILLKPHFVESLDQFEARHTGPCGEIISSWKKEGNRIRYTVTLPTNSTATLDLGDGITRLLGTGRHELIIDRP